mgnify:CR=1 FL=1
MYCLCLCFGVIIACISFSLVWNLGWERVDNKKVPYWVKNLMKPGKNRTYTGKYYKYRVSWHEKTVMYRVDEQAPTRYKTVYVPAFRRKVINN